MVDIPPTTTNDNTLIVVGGLQACLVGGGYLVDPTYYTCSSYTFAPNQINFVDKTCADYAISGGALTWFLNNGVSSVPRSYCIVDTGATPNKKVDLTIESYNGSQWQWSTPPTSFQEIYLTKSLAQLPAAMSLPSSLVGQSLDLTLTVALAGISRTDYTTQQSFTFGGETSLAIVLPNNPPSATNPGPQSSAEGAAVSLQIQAADADNDPLTYGALGLPAGLAIDPDTGLISGALSYESAGSYPSRTATRPTTSRSASPGPFRPPTVSRPPRHKAS